MRDKCRSWRCEATISVKGDCLVVESQGVNLFMVVLEGRPVEEIFPDAVATLAAYVSKTALPHLK